MAAAQSALSFVPHLHGSDVFLFLRLEQGGREGGRVGETVIWDGHGAFLENCSSGRFLAFIVYTPGLINVESFSISHVNAHTETCIGEL